jgi:hypothetical protein
MFLETMDHRSSLRQSGRFVTLTSCRLMCVFLCLCVCVLYDGGGSYMGWARIICDGLALLFFIFLFSYSLHTSHTCSKYFHSNPFHGIIPLLPLFEL